MLNTKLTLMRNFPRVKNKKILSLKSRFTGRHLLGLADLMFLVKILRGFLSSLAQKFENSLSFLCGWPNFKKFFFFFLPNQKTTLGFWFLVLYVGLLFIGWWCCSCNGKINKGKQEVNVNLELKETHILGERNYVWHGFFFFLVTFRSLIC